MTHSPAQQPELAPAPPRPPRRPTPPARCREALIRVRHLAGKAIVDLNMTQAGDRILVGVSGGNDSLVLMHVLESLRRASPVPFEIFPVTVDIGFKAFDAAGLRDYCQAQGWNLEIVRIEAAGDVTKKWAPDRPCAYCSRLRRGQIYGAANRLGCGTIALGHHMDDLCVSFLMSVFRGGGLRTMAPICAADAGSKRLIRPLYRVPKALIKQAAAELALPTFKSCDYAEYMDQHGDRAYVERLLAQIDGKFQNLRPAMLRSLSNLQPDHLLDRRFHGSDHPAAGDDEAFVGE